MDETVLREVARIGNRVVAASDHPELEYRFRVINTPVVNAFATCGGFVYVTSGLLDILEAPDELAAAIAHEVAHIDQLHLVERIRSTRIKKVLFISAGIALALLASDWAIEEQGPPTPYTTQRSPSDIVSTFGQGGFEMGVGLATVSIRGYNKRRELAADRAAVGYLQRSGFDPYALLRLFQRLESAPVNSSLAVSSSALVNAEPGLSQRKQALSSLLKAGVTGGTAVPPEPEGKRR
ncbi:MAG: M48 family metalloprotease [bacterium]|nr:M48 family metalloprotease [bacterium]